MFSKSKNNAINIITIIAGVGVFAGTLALLIVLSGFAGLKAFSIQYTNEIDPDLKAVPATGKYITLDSTHSKKLRNVEGIQAYSKVIEERVLLTYENRSMPAMVKGVDFNFNNVTATDKSIIAGFWFKQGDQQAVMGIDIAQKLSMGLSGYGDVLNLRVPKPGKGIITDPSKAFNSMNIVPVGIYSINEELNDKYVFMPLSSASQLLSLNPAEISGIEIKLAPGVKESTIKSQLQDIFGEEILIKNRIELNDELYKMLNTENLAVYLIFTLVLIIALFNVGGAIVMAILDKRENIKTLFNLGANLRSIQRIFFLQGTLLTLIGGVLGLLVGIVIIFLQQQFGLVMITQNMPYPVILQVDNLIIVFLTIMVLGIAASFIGSTRVSKALASVTA